MPKARASHIPGNRAILTSAERRAGINWKAYKTAIQAPLDGFQAAEFLATDFKSDAHRYELSFHLCESAFSSVAKIFGFSVGIVLGSFFRAHFPRGVREGRWDDSRPPGRQWPEAIHTLRSLIKAHFPCRASPVGPWPRRTIHAILGWLPLLLRNIRVRVVTQAARGAAAWNSLDRRS